MLCSFLNDERFSLPFYVNILHLYSCHLPQISSSFHVFALCWRTICCRCIMDFFCAFMQLAHTIIWTYISLVLLLMPKCNYFCRSCSNFYIWNHLTLFRSSFNTFRWNSFNYQFCCSVFFCSCCSF